MKIDRKLFLDVFHKQATTGNKYSQTKFASWITGKCLSWGHCKVEYDKIGNLYITKGSAEFFPCVVAHLDQVHHLVDSYSVILHKDYAFAMDNRGGVQVGIGGDDKCGIYIALEMYRTFDNIKLVFFVDEESGGIGSGQANLQFFDDCSFVVQPDRNHLTYDYINHTNGIAVTSDEFDMAMADILIGYGYEEAIGSFTDIGVLKENGLGICAFNISCGYLHAHTDREIVCIPELEDCLEVAYEAIDKLSYRKWEHISEYKWSKYGTSNLWDNLGWDYTDVYDDLPPADASISVYDDLVWEAMSNCEKRHCDVSGFQEDLDGSIFCSKCSKTIETNLYGKHH